MGRERCAYGVHTGKMRMERTLSCFPYLFPLSVSLRSSSCPHELECRLLSRAGCGPRASHLSRSGLADVGWRGAGPRRRELRLGVRLRWWSAALRLLRSDGQGSGNRSRVKLTTASALLNSRRRQLPAFLAHQRSDAHCNLPLNLGPRTGSCSEGLCQMASAADIKTMLLYI